MFCFSVEKLTFYRYSPIYKRYSHLKWPLYCLDGLSFVDDDNEDNGIEFHSWKGDYEIERYSMPYGNLGYEGKRRALTGNIWTRG